MVILSIFSTTHRNINNNNNDHHNHHHQHTTIITTNNHNTIITQKELEEQRRHAEGVDALLNLAQSPIILKRPASTSILDIQSNQIHHKIQHNPLEQQLLPQHPQQFHQPQQQVQQHQQIHFTSSTLSTVTVSALSNGTASLYSHTPPKKIKTNKNLRYKLKKKAWMR